MRLAMMKLDEWEPVEATVERLAASGYDAIEVSGEPGAYEPEAVCALKAVPVGVKRRLSAHLAGSWRLERNGIASQTSGKRPPAVHEIVRSCHLGSFPVQ
jgi:hypothetical protein